jgi:hypothetical protein
MTRAGDEVNTMRKKRQTARQEILWRSVAVSAVSMRVFYGAVHVRGHEPEINGDPWLEIHGTLDEAVGPMRDIDISVFAKDKREVGPARPAAVGSIIQLKPVVQVVVPLDRPTFQALWMLALSGHLRHASLHFTRPHYGNARVINVSFSNEPEE